jgi:hypothetical protein
MGILAAPVGVGISGISQGCLGRLMGRTITMLSARSKSDVFFFDIYDQIASRLRSGPGISSPRRDIIAGSQPEC